MRAEKKLLYIKVCKYNKDEKQRQGMETSRLISQVPSLPQPGKITPFGVTLCFAWSEDLTIQKYKCLAKAPDPEFGEEWDHHLHFLYVTELGRSHLLQSKWVERMRRRMRETELQ